MDLLDVYTAFSQTKPQSDEENMKENSHNVVYFKRYKFGSVVENEKLPCYKIDKEGKISAYLSMIESKSKK